MLFEELKLETYVSKVGGDLHPGVVESGSEWKQSSSLAGLKALTRCLRQGSHFLKNGEK